MAGRPLTQSSRDDQFSIEDFIKDLFEQPELLEGTFESFKPKFGKSSNMERFFRSRFGDILGEFQGALRSQALDTGGAPTMRLSDFLEDFDFGRRFGMTPPSIAGRQTARFAPPTRFFSQRR